MEEERFFLDSIDMEQIADRLAWTSGEWDAEVIREWGLEPDSLEPIMEKCGYQWLSSIEIWWSLRPIWRDWDGRLPSKPE